VVSQQNESIGVLEWKRPQQDTLDERKDSGSGPDAQRQRENDDQGESRCLPQLAKCEAKLLYQWGHAPPNCQFLISYAVKQN
jgi:hypothetical protein